MSKKKKTTQEENLNEYENNLMDEQLEADEAASDEKKSEQDADEKAQLIEKLEQEKDRYIRLFAEFENYKKRTSKERIELLKTAGEEIMTALLPVLDDFERALKELERAEDDSLYTGVKLINDKLRNTLKTKGLEPVEVKAGDAFDAETQEAITQIPAPEDNLKGKVVDVVERGYRLADKIIRYPKVVVGH